VINKSVRNSSRYASSLNSGASGAVAQDDPTEDIVVVLEAALRGRVLLPGSAVKESIGGRLTVPSEITLSKSGVKCLAGLARGQALPQLTVIQAGPPVPICEMNGHRRRIWPWMSAPISATRCWRRMAGGTSWPATGRPPAREMAENGGPGMASADPTQDQHGGGSAMYNARSVWVRRQGLEPRRPAVN